MIRKMMRGLARSVAPTAYAKLEAIEVVDGRAVTGDVEIAELQAQVEDLQAQISELRQDNRRVAELYDVVFERLRQDNPLKAG